MSYYNSALLQDEILISLSLVMDHGLPVRPSFLHSLGTLIEATVLHDRVYFDPLNHTLQENLDPREGAKVLRESAFVQTLVREGALALFPGREEIDAYIEANCSDYTITHFIQDFFWQPTSFASYDPREERDQYVRAEYLLDNHADVFQTKRLVDYFEPGEPVLYLSASAASLAAKGTPVENILFLEGLNHKAHAYLDLSRRLGLTMYCFDTALPYQFGAIESVNRRAREMYETIRSKLNEVDAGQVGRSDFKRINVPEFCQIVLANSKDSSKAVLSEILNLRLRHSRFRSYLTEFEEAWESARTKGDRLRLHNQFVNAWKALTAATDRPSTRLIYKLWDVVKSPTKVLEKLGDKLREEGHELSVIEQARGLREIWNELLACPISSRNEQLVARVFPHLVDQEIWDAAERFHKSAEGYLNRTGLSSR